MLSPHKNSVHFFCSLLAITVIQTSAIPHGAYGNVESGPSDLTASESSVSKSRTFWKHLITGVSSVSGSFGTNIDDDTDSESYFGGGISGAIFNDRNSNLHGSNITLADPLSRDSGVNWLTYHVSFDQEGNADVTVGAWRFLNGGQVARETVNGFGQVGKLFESLAVGEYRHDDNPLDGQTGREVNAVRAKVRVPAPFTLSHESSNSKIGLEAEGKIGWIRNFTFTREELESVRQSQPNQWAANHSVSPGVYGQTSLHLPLVGQVDFLANVARSWRWIRSEDAIDGEIDVKSWDPTLVIGKVIGDGEHNPVRFNIVVNSRLGTDAKQTGVAPEEDDYSAERAPSEALERAIIGLDDVHRLALELRW